MAEAAPLVAVLAAGAGARFNPDTYGAKLDADLAGKPVGQWVLDAVAGAGLSSGVIVVARSVPRFAANSGWELLANPQADQGLGTSLALAARTAMDQDRALLVLLADMPLVSSAHIAALATNRCAATIYPDGKAGVPALLDRAMLPGLSTLSGNEGAGPLLSARADLVRLSAESSLLLDIDRVPDLALAAQLAMSRT